MMGPREVALRDWLGSVGWGDAEIRPLAGDASNRRYLRLKRSNGHHGGVVMDAPAERGEDIRPFLALTAWLRAEGLSAPEPFAADADRGFLLLEDLGDDLFARVAERQAVPETVLYAAAVDLLADLTERDVPSGIDHLAGRHALAPYDMPRLIQEARLATDWYLRGSTGDLPRDLVAEFEERLAAPLLSASEARDTVVLRDFHAENLIWLPARDGAARVGLLDYQDALAGHAAYDLVSLLEDARRDTTPELQRAMLDRYLARSAADREAFHTAYAVLGAQRNLKIIGIFARLCIRDGKPGYLRLIPRVWNHLMNDLSHPALAELRHFVQRHLPAPEPGRLAALEARKGMGSL